MRFAGESQHIEWLQTQAALPAGFQAATCKLRFMPKERPKEAEMT
ncbi:MAG: arginine biosynthesis protein ArgJ, partial [Proteobacteria bacterium]